LRHQRRSPRLALDLGEELGHGGPEGGGQPVDRQAAPHAPPEVRRALAQDLKTEYQLKRMDAVEQMAAEHEVREAALKADMRVLAPLALAVAAAVGAAAAAGVWFLVNYLQGPPRPRRAERYP
jgi:hypothetical protein